MSVPIAKARHGLADTDSLRVTMTPDSCFAPLHDALFGCASTLNRTRQRNQRCRIARRKRRYGVVLFVVVG